MTTQTRNAMKIGLILLFITVVLVMLALPLTRLVAQDTTSSTGIIFPTSGGVLAFLDANHMIIALMLSAVFQYAISHWIAAAAAWGDWVKRGSIALANIAVIVGLHAMGGKTPVDLMVGVNAIIEAIINVVVSGSIYRFGKTQPNTQS